MALYWRRPVWDWDIMDHPLRLFDQNFGSGLLDHDLWAPHPFSGRYRPLHFSQEREESGMSEVQCDRNKFQVMLDVKQFKPEDLKVKTVDGSISVEGKHEEQADEHGFISRHFIRRYKMPADVKEEELQCNLSSDGVLTLCVPRDVKELVANERSIPIVQTGQPAMIKQQKKEEGVGDVQMKDQ